MPRSASTSVCGARISLHRRRMPRCCATRVSSPRATLLQSSKASTRSPPSMNATASLSGPSSRTSTCRSRNDQVATDFRLWVRNACDHAMDAIRNLQRTLVESAEEHVETVMPGFTHLQVAQPVTLGHHLMAYYQMLRRDYVRFM